MATPTDTKTAETVAPTAPARTNKPISASIPVELHEKIEEHGWATRRKTSAVVQEALEEYASKRNLSAPAPKA